MTTADDDRAIQQAELDRMFPKLPGLDDIDAAEDREYARLYGPPISPDDPEIDYWRAKGAAKPLLTERKQDANSSTGPVGD
jgi:hypothetical protein